MRYGNLEMYGWSWRRRWTIWSIAFLAIGDPLV
jgi:hypothetical protein